MNSLPLNFDRRPQLDGKPGLHALIAGVSGYPYLPQRSDTATPHYFEMTQLVWTSRAAFQVANWIVDHQDDFTAPLATVRLLVSPTAAESSAEPALNDLPPCSLDHFLMSASEWRADARSHPENITLLFFAGYGAERSRTETVLLMQDFGDLVGSQLRQVVSVDSIVQGMSPAQRQIDIARTQVYVVDAVRVAPSTFEELAGRSPVPVFDPESSVLDDRSVTTLYASRLPSPPGNVPGKTTAFTQAFLEAFEGEGAVIVGEEMDGRPRWGITTRSLSAALENAVPALSQISGEELYLTVGGSFRDAPLRNLDGPTTIRVTIEILASVPLETIRLTVANEEGAICFEAAPPEKHQLTPRLLPGAYQVQVHVGSAAATSLKWYFAEPQRSHWKVRVQA